MTWYVATFVDREALYVLTDRIRGDVTACRDRGTLPATAEAYVMGAGSAVQLTVNDAARSCLPSLQTLAWEESPPPLAAERVKPLIY